MGGGKITWTQSLVAGAVEEFLSTAWLFKIAAHRVLQGTRRNCERTQAR